MWFQESPDFTQCFYLTVLVYVPCGLLWLLTPLELFILNKRKVNQISWTFCSVSKVAVASALIAISCLDIGLVVKQFPSDSQTVFPVHFVTPLVRIMSFLLTIKLVMLHRRKGVQSSGLLFIFWIALLIAALPQLRSVLRGPFQVKYDSISYIAYSTCVLLMFLLNCVSDSAPQNHKPRKNASPELEASFLRQILFQWFDGFMFRGVKTPIEAETIWELNDDDVTDTLNEAFSVYWERCLEHRRASKAKPRPAVNDLLRALYDTAGFPVWTTAILRLVIIGLSLSSPQIVG